MAKRKNRVGDIECRDVKSNHYSKEIVKWFPNSYYGREAEYELTISGDFYKLREGSSIHIHKNCFTSPETCYVIAFLIKTEEGFDLRTVGDRLLDLSSTDLEDFLKVYKKAVKFKNV